MDTIKYNDMEFTVERGGAGWDILRRLPGGAVAVAATGVFQGLAEAEAWSRALALVKTIYPVGVRMVGPDVNHPNTIGDLKIIGPDVGHPNFIHWTTDSVSCPKHPGRA
ncbi:MAG: hypothetical protein ABSH53_14265 [Holophaga sp.]|jgi:hypothetical protein